MKNLIEILPNIYGVKVPSDAHNFKIHKPFIDKRLYWNAKENDVSYLYNQPLDTGDWKILGTLTKDEISFDASEVVESKEIIVFDFEGGSSGDTCYKDYEYNYFDLSDSEQSFRSALPKEIYFENEYGSEEPTQESVSKMPLTSEGWDGKYWRLKREWQTAQENITEKLLILQKK